MDKCNAKILNRQYSFVNLDIDINKSEDNRIISQCIGNDIKLDLIGEIGRGGFGYVYLGLYSENNEPKMEVAVKKMIGTVSSNNKTFNKSSSNLDDFYKEVEYSIFMANKGIGPKIYKAFYITDEEVVEEESNYFVKHFVLYIIMEKFDNSLEKFLDSKDVSKENKEIAIKMSMDLLKDQIYKVGLYCIDIKPGNYVVNLGSDGKLNVKMIDFGADYCKRSVNELRYTKGCVLANGSKDTVYVYNLLQLYELLVSKEFSYVILTDPKFTEYFINNAVNVKNTVIQVYYEGSEQQMDQCHLVWFYGRGMYYHYDKSSSKDDLYKSILDDNNNDSSIKLKLANDMYDILYHFINKENKVITPKISRRFRSRSHKKKNFMSN